jgi:TPR repeat protein
VFAFWPRIEPSAATMKAAVEQPVFVTRPAIGSPAKAAAVAVEPLGKDAINKLATAMREQPPSANSPILTLSIPIDEARRLCAEGLVAFANGDIAAARGFLVRAAEGGDARALMALGDTYDPTTLARLGVVGLKGDEVAARRYYSRALAAGVGGARERIESLAAK